MVLLTIPCTRMSLLRKEVIREVTGLASTPEGLLL